MNPRLIKLASGEALYANQDLIKFVKQQIAKPSEDLVPNDVLYFTKNVAFKRDLLTVSKIEYRRTILIPKATAFIINPEISFPAFGKALVGNKISDDSPLEHADDVIFNISSFGEEYVNLMKQWYEYSQLSIQPKLVHESELGKFINSGITIDETNLDMVLSLLETDHKIGIKMIDTCDFNSSFPYMLYLLHFSGKNGEMNSRIHGYLTTAKSFLVGLSCYTSLTDQRFKEVLNVPELCDRLTAKVLNNLAKTCHSNLDSGLKRMIGNIDINIAWNK